MLKINPTSLLQNLLVSIDIAEKDEIVGENVFDKTIKICLSPKSSKTSKFVKN